MRVASAHAISVARQPLAAIDLPEDRVLHLIAVAGDARRDSGQERERAHDFEDGIEIGEIGLRLLDDAAE